jgi:hypothetical protein
LEVLKALDSGSIDAVATSPPYGVGKDYEQGQTYSEWLALIQGVFALLPRVFCPDGFVIVVMADIRCHPDPFLPAARGCNLGRQRGPTTEELIAAIRDGRAATKAELCQLLACSEQTVDPDDA